MKRFHFRPTYSNVVATLALFFALAGGAWAATQLPKESVGSTQLKNGAVTPGKLSAEAKKGFTGARGEAGAQGALGPRGTEGPRGENSYKEQVNAHRGVWLSALHGLGRNRSG